MSVYEQGIRQRRLISFLYEGLPRVVVPAVYGYTHPGKLSLRGYLVGGYSSSDTANLWRLFTLAKAAKSQLLDEIFDGLPPGYRKHDGAFQYVIARL